MEGNETPKVDPTVISPEVPSEGNKELEQKASELAITVRQNGIVNMFLGQRLSRESPPPVASFIQGTEVDTSSRRKDILFWISEDSGALHDMLSPHDLLLGGHYDYQTLAPLTARNKHRQIWKIARYVPPMKKEFVDKTKEVKTKRFGFIPKTERHVERALQLSNEPLSYDGKRGESDWTQYDYYMRRYDKGEDRREGSLCILSVAVPPNIAAQIDEEVAKDIYFPDAFLKALYPGYVGLDINRNLKRFQTTEIQIVDCRSKPEKDSVLEYPQPLPY